jgi:hypothetical protein
LSCSGMQIHISLSSLFYLTIRHNAFISLTTPEVINV